MNELEYEIPWSDEYLLGDEKVDNQHKRIFRMVNDLLKACDEGFDVVLLQETLDFLVNYAVQHFNDEEELQRRCNFPELESHRQEHEDFKKTVLDYAEEFKKGGSSADLSNVLNQVVVTWLIKHVSYEDQKISQYINKEY